MSKKEQMPASTGGIFIDGRCARLIECLPSLQHDPNRPEDVLKVDADEDGVGGDDTADCLRYLVATRERKVTQRKLRGLTASSPIQRGRVRWTAWLGPAGQPPRPHGSERENDYGCERVAAQEVQARLAASRSALSALTATASK